MPALTFQNSAEYDKISILGLKDFAPGKPLDVEITHKDGSKDHIKVHHSFNAGPVASSMAATCGVSEWGSYLRHMSGIGQVRLGK
jgi:hypothetical protein